MSEGMKLMEDREGGREDVGKGEKAYEEWRKMMTEE